MEAPQLVRLGQNRRAKMTYSELVAKLEKIEREHGVYLFDQSVDAENIGKVIY